MTDHIKLLEELIVEAVDRLRSLNRERDALQEEVESLRERLEGLKHEASLGDRGSDDERAWEARRSQALATLREALTELDRFDRATR